MVRFIAPDANMPGHFWVVIDDDEIPYHEKFASGDSELLLKHDFFPLGAGEVEDDEDGGGNESSGSESGDHSSEDYEGDSTSEEDEDADATLAALC